MCRVESWVCLCPCKPGTGWFVAITFVIGFANALTSLYAYVNVTPVISGAIALGCAWAQFITISIVGTLMLKPRIENQQNEGSGHTYEANALVPSAPAFGDGGPEGVEHHLCIVCRTNINNAPALNSTV